MVLSCKFENVRIMKHNATNLTPSAKLKAPQKTVPGVLELSGYIRSSTKDKNVLVLDKIPNVGECHSLLVDADWAQVGSFHHTEIISIMQWYNEDMTIAVDDNIDVRAVKLRNWLTGIYENAAPAQLHQSAPDAEHGAEEASG
jgi:hypothetical protein